MSKLEDARDILRENWAYVADALAREAGVRDPVALLLDFRFAGARRLGRQLCWDANVEELEAGCGPDELVLVGVANRRDAAAALALVSPRTARRIRRRRIPAGHALAVVVGDGWASGLRVRMPAGRVAQD
jgi:hypothetical protein